uniref:Putative nuclear protein es2 n=1 Tax=Triatoma infestans TaxID=30076 RepID=A0A023F174_TRIIF
MNSDKNNALLKADDNLFKQPPIPKSKKVRKQKVLEEDSYLEEMGKIIQRDFFPDLEKLKAQNDYLDALNRNDTIKLQQIHAKYTQGSRTICSERYSSPATFETPNDNRTGEDETFRQSSADAVKKEEPSNDTKSNMSLDEYLGSHTSEDNQSFEEIIAESAKCHRQKYPWLYKEESLETNEDLLSLPSADNNTNILRPKQIDTWSYKDKNYIMYVPDGVDLTPEEKVEMAKRKQEIVHSNTRLKVNPFDEIENKERIQDMAHSQAKSLDGKIGVDGKELVTETPKVNGFSFVNTPSPAPGVNESPLMTWGEIEGTPFRLDGGDTPLRTSAGLSYFVPEPPKRERLALKLADKVGERHRDQKKKAIEAARRQLTSPLSRPGSLDRLQMLSPAAKKFASTQLQRFGTDKRLTAYYSPARPSNKLHTPKIQDSTPATPHNAITTDNLLKLNVKRRPKAADFFN